MRLNASLTLTARAFEALLSHVLVPDPFERVGLVVGAAGVGHDVLSLHNHDRRPNRFAVDPAQIDAVATKASRRDQVPLARVHTHLNGRKTPTTDDLSSLPEGWLELIVCLHGSPTAPRLGALGLFDKRGRVLPLVCDTAEPVLVAQS